MTIKTLLILIIVLFVQAPAYATCSKSYTLGFFNGVWNTNYQADLGRNELRILIGDTYNNEPVNYTTFYNHTGPGYDVIGLQDLAETFIQRSAEIDASGELGRRFEYFWEFIGSSEPTFIDKIKGIFSNAIAIFESLYTAVNTKLVAIISYFASNPPTEADYASHNAKLDALAADGQKLMLVGHSQGNLFMNHGYDHILPTVGVNRVAAAHIAPASPTLRGDYLLANIDLVINALRIQGANSVPDINLSIPVSKVDVSGHTLIGTYLDSTRDGRGRVKTMIETEMGGLKCPYVVLETSFSFYTYYTSDYIFFDFGGYTDCGGDYLNDISLYEHGPEKFYYRFYSDGSYEYIGRSYFNSPETNGIPYAAGMPSKECLQKKINDYIKQLYIYM